MARAGSASRPSEPGLGALGSPVLASPPGLLHGSKANLGERPAKPLGVSQPEVSRLFKGHLRKALADQSEYVRCVTSHRVFPLLTGIWPMQ